MKKTYRIISLIVIICISMIGLTGCGKDDAKVDRVYEDALFNAAEKATTNTKKAIKKEFEIMVKEYGYEGNISAEDTKDLIKLVDTCSGEVALKGIVTIENVDSQSTYNVTFERDDEGLISIVTIEEN